MIRHRIVRDLDGPRIRWSSVYRIEFQARRSSITRSGRNPANGTRLVVSGQVD